MGFLPKLPSVPVPGPKPLPVLGATGNLFRFFADPVGWLLRLHRDFGPIASLTKGNAALVCAFGPDLTRSVLQRPALFPHSTQTLFPLPPGSSIERLVTNLVLMNGEQHKRLRRLMTPAF